MRREGGSDGELSASAETPGVAVRSPLGSHWLEQEEGTGVPEGGQEPGAGVAEEEWRRKNSDSGARHWPQGDSIISK